MPGASRARSVETVVVGAGQAGLVISLLLRQSGREHVILDRRSTLGGGWQDRWDAFRLVSPNWTASMPGFAYRGSEPDGFMPRAGRSFRRSPLYSMVRAADAATSGSNPFRASSAYAR